MADISTESPAPIVPEPARPAAASQPATPADPVEPVDAPAETTLVIEDGVIPPRVRRPTDLVRLLVVLLAIAGTVLVAYFATSTTSGLDADLSEASKRLGSLAVTLLNLTSGLGGLALPIAASIDLLARRRGRQLLDAVLAGLLTVFVLGLVSYLVVRYGTDQLRVALAGTTSSDLSQPVDTTIGAVMAFAITARLFSRNSWRVISVLVIASICLVEQLTGNITIAGIALSLFTGMAVGLAVRYALGTPTTRPTGIEVAGRLEHAGYPLTVLRAILSTGYGRRYVATTRDGDELEVVVLDRDLEGSAIWSTLRRTLLLRGEPGSGGFSMRQNLEHLALMGYALESAEVPAPRLLVVREVGPDAAVIAYERIDGRVFSDIIDSLSDGDLDNAWRALKVMQEHGIAHRHLSADHLVRDRDGKTWLFGVSHGVVAAGDVVMRVDVAEMLCTLALLTDVDRAVASARRVLGDEALLRALPVLQPVALSAPTRRAIRHDKSVLVALRDELVELTPGAEPEQIQLRRGGWRTMLTIVLASFAGYVLLSQLARVDFGVLFRTANWWWAGGALVLSAVTFFGAALSLSGFVLEKLSWWRTFLAQLSAAFATLIAPPTLGTVAINVRYLQKSGLHPALAAASVGVSQVVAFVIHIFLLVGFAIVAGNASNIGLQEHLGLVLGFGAVLLLMVLIGALPPIRRWIVKRVRPVASEVLPRLVTVAQRPAKLLEGIGGILLLNFAFCLCLAASLQAFGGGASFAAIAVVYLAGSTLGQAAPTPGGLGAVEAALAAGLAAFGVDAGVAFSAVILYRLVTFWIPTVPGWLSFQYLQRQGAL